MEIYQAYLQAQKAITDFLSGAGGVMVFIALLFLLRIASLIVKAWGQPYASTSYLGNGGRSIAGRRNSAPSTRPAPRLLILNISPGRRR